MNALARKGYAVFGPAPEVARWADAARGVAQGILDDPDERARWLRHGGTWFVGVDCLPSRLDGSIGGAPLRGPWEAEIGRWSGLHPAQLSAIYPGYPGRDPSESDAAHRYRLRRDGAHLDGLHALGPERRRFLREPHAFVLGIPLGEEMASPLTVWEGSHEIIRGAFRQAFQGVPVADWADTDVTEVYQAARAGVFERCPRVPLPVRRGESVLLHRLTIHGIAPWDGTEETPRLMAYLRPILTDPGAWLSAP